MNSLNKGEYGYLKKYKYNKLLFSLLFALMIAFSVIATILMFGDTMRVAILFAILLALPFAKFIVAYILVVRFKPINEDDFNVINDAIESNDVLYDIIISQYEGLKHYDALIVKNGRIYGFVSEKDFNKNNYEKWLINVCNDSKYQYPIGLYNNVNDFIKKIKSVGEPNDNTKLVDKHIKERLTDSSL